MPGLHPAPSLQSSTLSCLALAPVEVLSSLVTSTAASTDRDRLRRHEPIPRRISNPDILKPLAEVPEVLAVRGIVQVARIGVGLWGLFRHAPEAWEYETDQL